MAANLLSLLLLISRSLLSERKRRKSSCTSRERAQDKPRIFLNILASTKFRETEIRARVWDRVGVRVGFGVLVNRIRV